jgi:two-component system sensor histidine kinase KdpD
MGLGLPVCREIVEAHGGTIRVFAHADHGTSFAFVLPLVDASPPHEGH